MVGAREGVAGLMNTRNNRNKRLRNSSCTEVAQDFSIDFEKKVSRDAQSEICRLREEEKKKEERNTARARRLVWSTG